MGIEIRIPCLKDKNWPHVRCFLQNVYNSGVAESLSQLSKLDTKIKFRYVSDAFSGTSLLFVSPSQHAKPRRQEHEWHRAGSAPDLLGQPLLESEKADGIGRRTTSATGKTETSPLAASEVVNTASGVWRCGRDLAIVKYHLRCSSGPLS